MGDNVVGLSLPGSSSNDRVTLYLEELSRKCKAISQFREVPQSPPRPSSIPEDEATRDKRIQEIRELAMEAWSNTNGNPADGQWAFLSQILKMDVTSGRDGRWLGTRTDTSRAKPLGDGQYWINAETESQWLEWEARDEEERRLREKVENWKRALDAQETFSNLDVPPLAEASTSQPHRSPKSSQMKPSQRQKIATMKTSGSVPKGVIRSLSFNDPLKNNSLFGFSVVKRTTSATAKPKDKPDDVVKESSQPSQSQDKNAKNIADYTDFSLLPPSFASDVIESSTPKPRPKSKSKSANARKPDIIPDVVQESLNPDSHPVLYPPSPQTPSFARNKRITRLQSSFSLPAIPPSTPPRNPIQTTTNKLFSSNTLSTARQEVNVNNKRPAEPNTPQSGDADSRALKKARTLPSLPISPTQLSPHAQRVLVPPSALPSKIIPDALPVLKASAAAVEPASDASVPNTPVKQTIPTLRELLASRKKRKRKTGSPNPLTRRAVAVTAQADRPGDKQTGKEVLESARKSPAPAIPAPQLRKSASLPAQQMLSSTSVLPRKSPTPAPRQPVMDPYADDADFSAILAAPPARSSQNVYDTPFDPYADYPIDSPTKSLSSIADSNEEDSDDDEGEDGNDTGLRGNWNPILTTGFGAKPFVFDPPVTSTQVGSAAASAQVQAADSWESIYEPSSNKGTVQGEAASNAYGTMSSVVDEKDKYGFPSSIPSMPSTTESQRGLKIAVAPLPPPSSAEFPAYNSQFAAELARRVDSVDRLLERDTNGWMRQPTPEAQVAPSGMEDSP